MNILYAIYLISFIGFAAVRQCCASCYFPAEMQGVYVTQSTVSGVDVVYSQINITSDLITIWGNCHRRVGNNMILMMASLEEEEEDTSCFRCFHITLVTKNIVRVYTTMEYMAKCFTNEEKAIMSCPSEDSLRDPEEHTEIILFKIRELDGQVIRRREYCPISGRYNFTFATGEKRLECLSPKSTLDTCPSGSSFNLRFRDCNFEDMDASLECLGHWTGYNGVNYLALINTRQDEKLGPRYRCAVYLEDANSGVVTLSFSNDSTCTTSLRGVDGDSLTLFPVATDKASSGECSFPKWLTGRWKHMKKSSDSVAVFYDATSFKTHTMRCQEADPTNGKYLVRSTTQCGEERFFCTWLEQRSPNILEFQMSLISSATASASQGLCTDDNFDGSRWITQSRESMHTHYTQCPVSGEFTGFIPDAEGLCAKLSSDCKSQNILYYEVSACDTGEVYEEREYQCLGQWEENGLLYAFTYRRDLNTHECFVGAMMAEKTIFIREAGENCQRNLNPHRYGMELNKIGYCNAVSDQTPHSSHRHIHASSSSVDEITTPITPRPTEAPPQVSRTRPVATSTAPPARTSKIPAIIATAASAKVSPHWLLLLTFLAIFSM
ncbi:uncharacterized protein LOC132256448 [Phlebotomus argentipes]|uniref:uncharacterized protein LOC132256448 n=1 Tax=Phlebotomus argentipes TaxID=94469 RepID=UPI002893316D|nr:uncharacterized protein LOC132256448 [Phlebotomus argentipes]